MVLRLADEKMAAVAVLHMYGRRRAELGNNLLRYGTNVGTNVNVVVVQKIYYLRIYYY